MWAVGVSVSGLLGCCLLVLGLSVQVSLLYGCLGFMVLSYGFVCGFDLVGV